MPNCSICGKRSYSDYCVMHKPRKRIVTKKKLPTKTELKRYKNMNPLSISTKPVTQKGKHYYLWMGARTSWIELNMAKTWNCHYCGKEIKRSQLTLDHKIPRSRAPQLRYVLSNLVPCCFNCNRLKGSVTHDEYSHICHI